MSEKQEYEVALEILRSVFHLDGHADALQNHIRRQSRMIERCREALKPFAENAAWCKAEDGRACGMGCDMSEPGGPDRTHDDDCPMVFARNVYVDLPTGV